MADSLTVPSFYLYGDPQRDVTDDFVHVEDLDDRSRPSEWTIQPHVHRNLHHIILISEGGGTMQVEGMTMAFEAPSLLLMPAGVIHGFSWHSESRGAIATMADSFLHHLLSRDDDLPRLFRRPSAIALPEADSREIARTLKDLALELSWRARGQRGAIESLLLSIMVRAVRQVVIAPEAPGAGAGERARLVARLRERIEQRFRLRETVSSHARALGVSETSLRRACMEVAGKAPAAMLDERTLLEARRLLFYSQLSVSEVAYAVGFDDPAYFSRFFARAMGKPPRAYRAHGESRPA